MLATQVLADGLPWASRHAVRAGDDEAWLLFPISYPDELENGRPDLIKDGCLDRSWDPRKAHMNKDRLKYTFDLALMYTKHYDRNKRHIDVDSLHRIQGVLRSLQKTTLNIKCDDMYGFVQTELLAQYWVNSPSKLMEYFVALLDHGAPFWREDMNTARRRTEFLTSQAQRSVVWYMKFKEIDPSASEGAEQITQAHVYEDSMGMFTQEALDFLDAEVNG